MTKLARAGLWVVAITVVNLCAFEPVHGTLFSAGDAVSRVRVTAPQAFDRHGRNSRAWLSAKGQVLALYTDARGAALVDPMWAPTGDLTTPRHDHTATLLPSGQVLVVGGLSAPLSPALSSAELYDPTTGVWTLTGSLNTARALHTATLLPSGQVLVAGGITSLLPPVPLTSAEIYDPTTGVWTATGDLNAGRVFHTAVLLSTGQVLAAGGINFQSSLSSTELFDPSTGLWTPTGDLTEARGGHTATILPSGQVIVCGGYDPSTPPPSVLASAELYDPVTGSWMETGALATARYDHTTTLLQSGLVLASAGYSGVANGELTSAELYDPVAGAWSPTGDLATPRRVHTATLLPSGQVLVTGGLPADGGLATSSAELYDPVSGLWTATGALIMARFTHTATLLSSGQVLVSGGRTKDALDGVTLSSVELSVDDATKAPPKGASSGPTGLRRRP